MSDFENLKLISYSLDLDSLILIPLLGDHDHDYQPQVRILVPSFSIFNGMFALIFFTFSFS